MAKRTLKWAFRNNAIEVRFEESGQEISFDLTEIPGFKEAQVFETEGVDDMWFACARHGLKQKLADSVAAAAAKDLNDIDKVLAMQGVWKTICAGAWSSRKAAAPKVKVSDIKEKLAKMESKKREATVAALAELGINL